MVVPIRNEFDTLHRHIACRQICRIERGNDYRIGLADMVRTKEDWV